LNEGQLTTRLTAGEIVPLSGRDWDRLASGFEVVARHDTKVAGDLLIVRSAAGIAAVESPNPGDRVVRPLSDERTARSFVADRLRAYDRFWDG
jgi:hypothetical protein